MGEAEGFIALLEKLGMVTYRDGLQFAVEGRWVTMEELQMLLPKEAPSNEPRVPVRVALQFGADHLPYCASGEARNCTCGFTEVFGS